MLLVAGRTPQRLPALRAVLIARRGAYARDLSCRRRQTLAHTTVSLRALTLEQPPAQTLGGGLNSSLVVGTITPAAALLPGASVNIQFKLGVQQTGTFRFFVNGEATTGAVGNAPVGKGSPSLKRATPGIK